MHRISDGSSEGPLNSQSRVAAIPARAFSGSSLYISQSYGDRMTQILSTLAKFDAAVQGYQRDSKAVEASVSDDLKMSNSNTAKCFSAVETLATRYAAIASGIDAWDHGYSTPAEPVTLVLPPPSAPRPVSDPEPAPPMAPMGAPCGSSGGGCVRPFSVHRIPRLHLPSERLSGLGVAEGGGKNTTNTPSPKNPLRGGELPKSRRYLLSPSGGRRLRAKNTPRSARWGPVPE